MLGGNRIALPEHSKSERRPLWDMERPLSVSAVGLQVALGGQGCRHQYVLLIFSRTFFSLSPIETISLLASVTTSS